MSTNPALQAFIVGMQEKHGFEAEALTQIFDGQRPDPRVIRIMAPAPAQLTPNWAAYRSRFVNTRRIDRASSSGKPTPAISPAPNSSSGFPLKLSSRLLVWKPNTAATWAASVF